MLLIDNREAEVGELDIIFDQGVCPDEESTVPRRCRSLDATPLRRSLAEIEQCLGS